MEEKKTAGKERSQLFHTKPGIVLTQKSVKLFAGRLLIDTAG